MFYCTVYFLVVQILIIILDHGVIGLILCYNRKKNLSVTDRDFITRMIFKDIY